MNRVCPFNGCDKVIDSTLFACIGHWKTLDRYQQREIHECYDAWRHGEISAEELRARQKAVLDEAQHPRQRKGKP